MLLIDNAVAAEALDMETTIAALEASYRALAEGAAVCRPRIDVELPSARPDALYRWGTMEGGGPRYFAIRMKSDLTWWEERDGRATREKCCGAPGRYFGLILLLSSETAEPLAFLNDGVIQHMRVGGDGGIGVKHMARPDVETVGMLGSGGMARTHIDAFLAVRPGIRRLRVFSPTRAHRERFAAETAERRGIDARAVDDPAEAYRGAGIVAALTDSARPVLDGDLLEPGTHVINIGAGGAPDPRTETRIDAYLRFGDAPAPRRRPEFGVDDEYLSYTAASALPIVERTPEGAREGGHGALKAKRRVSLAEIFAGAPGRRAPEEITYSERGNLQGAQFWAVAGAAYERARARGLGRELPTEWFLQDIRN